MKSPCAHLQPIARALAARKIALTPIESPYAENAFTWWSCDCTFDANALRSRLGLADCVRYDEYDGRVAGSDATFTCTEHQMVIMGLHPSYAPKKTKRLTASSD